MNRLLLSLFLCLSALSARADEAQVQDTLMLMLARFTTYMAADYEPCAQPNSVGEACGCFKGENTMGADERGVRPNADLSMVCAFLAKYGHGKVQLPQGITWQQVERMAMESLVFAYSTHKANRLKPCRGGRYWGSVSVADHAWESSLWAMSVAYSAFFQWHRLSEAQRGYVYNLLKAECQYELERTIPTGYLGDTMAEENGWEACVLAATLGLFPSDESGGRWFGRLREFAINSYSLPTDARDTTIVDAHYDTATVASLYRGQNLFPDGTLQNHNYFHTSYQNVVVQELGEAALALKLFQRDLHGHEQWHTAALMHNCDRIMRQVLYWLALPDGELAMPNGNDWSLFLYDQITSYATSACFLRDAHALMLERRACQMIYRRQQTTPDGSFLLRPDVGARRMGVQAHRIMMTWLMHHVLSTADMMPTTWADFSRSYGEARVFESQNIVRGMSDSRFTTFAWSAGLKSYTGYVAPFSARHNNIVVPFRAHNTGNLLGWYEVEGCRTNAQPVLSGRYSLQGTGYVMNGELMANDSALNHRFALYSTPGNALIYIDNVRATRPVTILRERGALLAISTDPATDSVRTLHSEQGSRQCNGTKLEAIASPWVSIDGAISVVTPSGSRMAFGHRANNNSVLTSKLYACYSDSARNVAAGQVVGQRQAVYYANADEGLTRRLSHGAVSLNACLPDGWGGILAAEADLAQYYFLLCNFSGADSCTVSNMATPHGAPVLSVPTVISGGKGTATFALKHNHSWAQAVTYYVEQGNVKAWQQGQALCLHNESKRSIKVKVAAADGRGQLKHATVRLKALETRTIQDI